MWKFIKANKALLALLLCLITIAAVVNPQLEVKQPDGGLSIPTFRIVVGTTEAAGTADYTCDGVNDNVQFQAALDALPAGGGQIYVLGGTYVFGATVSRAIDNVLWLGEGYASYLTYDGVTAIIDAGVQTRWGFVNLRFDNGGVDVATSSDWWYENIWIGAQVYGYNPYGSIVPSVNNTFDLGSSTNMWKDGYFTGSSLYLGGHEVSINETTGGFRFDGTAIPRTATYVVAASDAPAHVKAQADYVCDGTADNVEIQAAIDACPAPVVVYTNMIEGGSLIQLTQGTFNIAATVVIDQPAISLVGAGESATTLKAITNLNDEIIRFDSSAWANGLCQVYLSDMTIDGNKDNNASGNSVDYSGARSSYFERLQLLHPAEYGFYADAAVKACDGVFWNEVYVVASQEGAFYSTGANNQLWYNDCYVLLVDNLKSAWEFTSSQGVFINHCTYDGGAPGQGFGVTTSGGFNLNINDSFFYGLGATKHAFNIATTDDITINNNVIQSTAVPNTSAALNVYAFVGTIDSLHFTNNRIQGNISYGVQLSSAGGGGVFNKMIIMGNDLEVTSTKVVIGANTTLTNCLINNNTGYIAPGEVRTASGSLTAGNVTAIGFAWHNPEAQDIYIKKVVVTVTTSGGTVGSHLDVGIADDAAGTNRGTEFFDDLLLNNTGVYESTLVATNGTQTVWVACQDSASVTDGWVVGQILDANAAALVGAYYIEYVGK